MNEIVREFLLETQENLAQLDLDLVTLEKEPTERETLARVFRTLHTVKGTAGFLGLMKLQAVSHAAESLLSRLRAGELQFNAPIASALLATVDAIRQMLAAVEVTEQDGDAEYPELVQTLERLRAGEPSAPPPSISLQPESVASPPPAARESVVIEPAEPRASAVADSTLRVDVGLLDNLMNLVGELVLARNQIMQFSGSRQNSAFLGTVQKLNLLTSELQTGVMKTRMQPIGNLWSKLPRLVRDISAACGNQVRLDMEGRETELDKTIIESIRDPLTHLVRNSIDHGIELPADRLARGKPAEGVLKLHAFHEGGKVIIEIADDGAGIDPRRIRDKAVRVNLLTPEQADRLSHREIIDLIFQPGFSTVDKVTNFSGRGVGMDVVRTNIEKIGGTVEIESAVGRGTTLRMKIPLTLAIIPALTVTSAGDRYAIPQVSLLELVRIEGDQARTCIEDFQGAPVYRLRGNLLPLVFLDAQFAPDAARRAPSENGVLNIVVLQADDRPFGLIVDGIHDTEEIVVKPLQKLLKGIGVYTGATIMGDGKVALILDVLGLAQRANVVSAMRQRTLSEREPEADEAEGRRQTLLVFAAADGGRMAIPISQVARLEEFPRSAIERVGPQEVIQYRHEILPLLDVSRTLRSRRGARAGELAARHAAEAVQVIVYAGKKQRIGLVVEQIVDIVEEAIVVSAPANRPGVSSTAVVQGRVTEILDIEALIGLSDPAFFEQPAPLPVGVTT